ncbi:MAG: inorganic phosphate transporter [Ruminococcaceae bacterium]|nr:inorganic phosphate transporter [Oscillospiraceae bacterium]
MIILIDVLVSSPIALFSSALTLCVIFVNGLTDAPNAVSTVISTRCLGLRPALFMSAVFNFLGVSVMSALNNSVTMTVSNIVDFGDDSYSSSVALSAALFAIVLWAILAWYFGIPTSESHALIAGLTGSAVAINSGFGGVNAGEWFKAVKGLGVSCAFGFFAGLLMCRIIIAVFRNVKRSKADRFFKYGQIFAAASMSFMHGAQDGQKFIAVLMLCSSFSGVASKLSGSNTYIIALCSAVMALGTLVGGKKIIKSVGMDMVRLEKFQGFSADLSASLALLLSTLWGFPVSTTHAKTTAMMGAGAAVDRRSINGAVIKDILLTWVLTFPGCALLGFFATKVFLKLF